MVERRFFVPPEDLKEGSLASLRGTEHHHLSRVLRLRAGDEVALFDGAGRGFVGIVETVGKDESLVRLTAPDERSVEPALNLTLAQGIPHHEKMELIVQKATELGVAAILPILAQRTVIRPDRGVEWNRLARWRKVARESARQSGRLRVPVVADPLGWADFVGSQSGAGEPLRLILCPPEPGTAAPDTLAAGRRPRSAVVAVGPEGGWTGAEIELAARGGFRRLELGPRILRAETAGIVAVALMLFLAGDLGPASSGRREP